MHSKLKFLLAMLILLPLAYFYKPKPSRPREKPKTHDVSSKLVTLNELSPDNKKGFRITAHSADLYDEARLVLSDAYCSLITDKEESAQLFSEETEFNTATKDLFLHNNIRGTFNDLSLMGSEFEYKFSDETITSNKLSTLTHPEFSISSKNTVIKLKNKTVELEGVESEFNNFGKQLRP